MSETTESAPILFIDDEVPNLDRDKYDFIHGRCLMVYKGLFFNAYYLNERSPTNDHPGQIGLFGGRHEKGHDPLYFLSTIAREIEEETGIDARGSLTSYTRMLTDTGGRRSIGYYTIFESDKPLMGRIKRHLRAQRQKGIDEDGNLVDDGKLVVVRNWKLFGWAVWPSQLKKMMPTTIMMLLAHIREF